MFDDKQSNPAGQDGDLDEGSANTPPAPSFNMGMNPNPAFGTPAPAVAIPDPAAASPVAPTLQMHDSAMATSSSENNTVTPQEPVTVAPAQPAASSTGPADPKLEDIKRQALEHLSPLVHQLEQTPEEKYKTLMMMIQASDNQDLLNEAYEAAEKITDEKARAEALLNIVNEINYFSQKTA